MASNTMRRPDSPNMDPFRQNGRLELPAELRFDEKIVSQAASIQTELVEMGLLEGDSLLTDGLSAAGIAKKLVPTYASAIVTAAPEVKDTYPEQSPFLLGYAVGRAVLVESGITMEFEA